MLKIAQGLMITNLSKPIYNKLHHAHCSGIVAFDDGELVVVWYHAIKEAHRDEQIYLTRKKPGNQMWTEPIPLKKHFRTRFDGNPAIWIAPDTKILWMFYNVGFGWSFCWAKYRVSYDRGGSWSKPKNIYPFISRGIKNPPILLDNGNYLLPSYVEFKYLRGVFFISKNQGKTWKQSKIVDLDSSSIQKGDEKYKGRQVEQPTIIQRKDGSIFALCRNSGNIKKMIETESYDRGKTWKPGTLGSLPNPAGGFHMIRLKSGNVAIIYNHAPAPNNERKWRNPLSVALSEDDGKTWKYRRNLLEWHPDEQGDEEKKYLKFEYPTITQGADGKIHATWSLSHLEIIENEKQEVRFTDIQYTSFSEEWIKEHGFFENAWEL